MGRVVARAVLTGTCHSCAGDSQRHEKAMLPTRLEDKRKATRRICKEEEEQRVARELALSKVRA